VKASVPRILFILHFPPPTHGSSIVGQYIKESRRINKTFDCRFINLGTSRKINEIGKKDILKLGRYTLIIWRVISHLVSFKPDLCYLGIAPGGSAFYKDALVAMMVKMTGIKMIYHCHGKGFSKNQDRVFDNWLYTRVFKDSDIVLLSKQLYPDIQKYVPEERAFYCPNGIPEIPGDIKLPEKHPDSEVKILFLSNLIESKGIFILLEACRLLKEKRLKFHCTFVGGEGDVSEKRFNEKVDELGLSLQVHYAGRKYGREKFQEFARSDIFAFPTYNDAFPLVNLEAMQFALPVISTYEGGIPDVVEDGRTGFLIPQNNSSLLANKLELLINNPALRIKMGEAGKEKYRQLYTLDIFEQRLASILLKSLKR
jgi:glycosyltransferase involved in cell wall biosynthesis